MDERSEVCDGCARVPMELLARLPAQGFQPLSAGTRCLARHTISMSKRRFVRGRGYELTMCQSGRCTEMFGDVLRISSLRLPYNVSKPTVHIRVLVA